MEIKPIIHHPAPFKIIRPMHSVLSLFSCGFDGRNDLLYIKARGVTECKMVDIDSEALERCERIYGFTQHYGDAFAFIKNAFNRGDKYDVIVADPWTAQEPRLWQLLPALRAMAWHGLILGISRRNDHIIASQPDTTHWKAMQRSSHNGGVLWAWREFV